MDASPAMVAAGARRAHRRPSQKLPRRASCARADVRCAVATLSLGRCDSGKRRPDKASVGSHARAAAERSPCVHTCCASQVAMRLSGTSRRANTAVRLATTISSAIWRPSTAAARVRAPTSASAAAPAPHATTAGRALSYCGVGVGEAVQRHGTRAAGPWAAPAEPFRWSTEPGTAATPCRGGSCPRPTLGCYFCSAPSCGQRPGYAGPGLGGGRACRPTAFARARESA